MRVLQVHNRYRGPGGEDTVLANEARLLREHGHEVELLEVVNPAADPSGLQQKLALARDITWSAEGASLMTSALKRVRPDLVHVHNTFTRLSPRVVRVATAQGLPVVQTLHNFRLVCANGLLLREGRPCELCVDGSRWQGVRRGCYRGSALASAAVLASGALHLRLGTYAAPGVRLIALTNFARDLLLRAGVPARVLRVKPNFVYRAAVSAAREQRVVFVGRLAPEKGVDLLLQAWRQLRPPGWTLELLGDGELAGAGSMSEPGIRFRGWCSPEEVARAVAGARFLVMASRWYETFGMVLIEAYAAGTPAVAPAHGAMGELVQEGVTGFRFEPGSVPALVHALQRATGCAETEWHEMSRQCLQAFESTYSPEANHRQLMAIYGEALAEVTGAAKART